MLRYSIVDNMLCYIISCCIISIGRPVLQHAGDVRLRGDLLEGREHLASRRILKFMFIALHDYCITLVLSYMIIIIIIVIIIIILHYCELNASRRIIKSIMIVLQYYCTTR